MPPKVLVIEDHGANLDLMMYLLQAFQFHPIPAISGQQGIQLALSERPDVILCDIQMPEMDGFEVLRRLKSHPELVATPVVAVTVMATARDRQRMLEAGFIAHFTKPIDSETFVADLELILNQQRKNSA